VKNRSAGAIHREIVLKFLNDNLALLAEFLKIQRFFNKAGLRTKNPDLMTVLENLRREFGRC
jgi:hypothetical protein